jgi:5'-nucleotidase
VKILLTNDDGVWADGLQALRRALLALGEVIVVAPEREQSAMSHALTMDRPVRLRLVEEAVYSVDGTPTDCVVLAVRGIPGVMKLQPDLIVSGINHGANLGDDVLYSGTVAAAAEGCLMGIPAAAVSLAAWKPDGFETAAGVACALIRQFLSREFPRGTLLNVNIPDLPARDLKGVRVTRLGRRIYPDVVAEQRDPWGRPFYWIGGEKPTWVEEEGLDFTAVHEGYVSVTPLQLDLTAHAAVEAVRRWDLALPPIAHP